MLSTLLLLLREQLCFMLAWHAVQSDLHLLAQVEFSPLGVHWVSSPSESELMVITLTQGLGVSWITMGWRCSLYGGELSEPPWDATVAAPTVVVALACLPPRAFPRVLLLLGLVLAWLRVVAELSAQLMRLLPVSWVMCAWFCGGVFSLTRFFTGDRWLPVTSFWYLCLVECLRPPPPW